MTARRPTTADIQIIRGLTGAERQLFLMETLLRSNWYPEKRYWRIDNLEVEGEPSKWELSRLVALVSKYPGKLERLVVAWVAATPCELDTDTLRRQLPFRFRIFDCTESANEWLLTQP